MVQDGKPKKYEEILMAALRFDESDLAANAHGSLSERQIARLQRRRRESAVLLTVLSLLMVLLAFLFSRVAGSVGLLLMGLAGLGALASALVLYITTNRITRDFQAPVREVEGRIELDTSNQDNKTAYRLKVDGVKFRISKREFLTFKNRDPYRIYYTLHSKKILSAEWLRGDFGPSDAGLADDERIAGRLSVEADAGFSLDRSADDEEFALGDDGELIRKRDHRGF